MLRFYVSDHPENWDEYEERLTHAYNLSFHRETGTIPFDLALSRQPPELTLRFDDDGPGKTRKDRTDFSSQLQTTTAKDRSSLTKAQRRYKSDFDKRLRKANDRPLFADGSS